MAKKKSFTAGVGLSFKDENENWYKANASIEIEFEEGDDIQAEKKKAWEEVFGEVEKQVEGMMNNK